MRARRPKNRWQRRRAGEYRRQPVRPQAPGQKRRLVRLGPGLILALIGSVVVWRGSPGHLRPSYRPYSRSLSHPVIAPTATASRGARIEPPAPALPSAPSLDFVLEHRAEVGLTAAQVQALRTVDRQWQRQIGPRRDALDRAARAFRSEMDAHKGRGAALQELRQGAAEMSALSRQLAGDRRAAWDQASSSLSVIQRERAERLWRERIMQIPAVP